MSKLIQTISSPCFALFRRNDQWQQVRCLTVITETGKDPSNKVEFPDRSTVVVSNSSLSFDGRIKRFVPHPDAHETELVAAQDSELCGHLIHGYQLPDDHPDAKRAGV